MFLSWMWDLLLFFVKILCSVAMSTVRLLCLPPCCKIFYIMYFTVYSDKFRQPCLVAPPPLPPKQGLGFPSGNFLKKIIDQITIFISNVLQYTANSVKSHVFSCSKLSFF